METQIGLAIMAHASRAADVINLQEQVDPDFISWDDGTKGENKNGDDAWRLLAGEPTQWSIVLQDDALPIENFRTHAALALRAAPPTAVGFYVGTCRPRADKVQRAVDLAERYESSWLEADTLLWGVGVAMPTAQIEPFLEWASRSMMPYDQRIGQWFHRQNLPVRYTWPSLVDHADGPSLAAHSTRKCKRVAHRVGVPKTWDGPIIPILDLGARIP